MKLISEFRTLPSDPEAVHAAVRVLADTGDDHRNWLAGVLERMANADGKTTLKEAERLREVRQWLGLS